MGATDNGLSERRIREIRRVLLAVVFVAVVTPRVAVTMGTAWHANGIVRPLSITVVPAVPILGEPVMFPLGMIGAWLLLFGLDRSKRLQTPLALLAVVVFVSVVVFVQDWWVGVVSLEADWPALVLGLGLGLAIGALPQMPNGRRTREFPVAAGALFVVVALAGVVSLLELYVVGDPAAVDGGFLPAPGTAIGAAIDIVALTAFTGIVGALVLYTDNREVAIVSGDDTDVSTVIAALFDETDPKFDGEITVGDAMAVLEARGAINAGNRPAPIPGKVVLRFLPPRRFSRWVSVDAEQHDPERIDAETLGSRRSTPGPVDVLRQQLPRRLRRIARPEAVRAATKLRRADLVLFVASVSAFDTGGDPDGPDDFGKPGYLSAYRELSDRLGWRTDQVAVVLGADAALPLYEDDAGVVNVRLDDDDFRDWLRTDLLDLPGADVIPLSDDPSDGALVGNVAELRRRIER